MTTRKINPSPNPKSHRSLKHKRGFTLAETLITLTTIGVIAAMTIPNLVHKYQKLVIETGLKKTYAELATTFERSAADNGPFDGWDFSLSSKEFVDKYFAPYIHLSECKPHNSAALKGKKGKCFAESDGNFYLWKTPNGNLDNEGIVRISPKYIMKDGRAIAIWNAYDAGRDWRIVNIVVDVNGPVGKSIAGQDVFRFARYTYNYGKFWDTFDIGLGENGGTAYRPESERLSNCKTTGRSCGYYIKKNGWKFPDNYPIKF